MEELPKAYEATCKKALGGIARDARTAETDLRCSLDR